MNPLLLSISEVQVYSGHLSEAGSIHVESGPFHQGGAGWLGCPPLYQSPLGLVQIFRVKGVL